MKFSQVKEIKEFCNNLFSTPDFREVVELIDSGEDDFEVDGVRFIKDSCIDNILAEELECDAYVLGCFNAEAIADATGWPFVLIKAASDSPESLGQAIIDGGFVADLAKVYSDTDGYGHHFNRHDGESEEVTFKGVSYHVFDNH